MTQKGPPRRTKSKARDPFASYREIGFAVTILQDPLENTLWASPEAPAGEVDWPAFLSGTSLSLEVLEPAAALSVEKAEMPLVSALVAVVKHVFDFVRRFEAAPTPPEVMKQLTEMRIAALALGSLAQGRDGRRPPETDPSWMEGAVDLVDAEATETQMQSLNGRVAALHPALQSQLVFALAHKFSKMKNESERERRFVEAIFALEFFFDNIRDVAHTLKVAAALTQSTAGLDGRVRRKGAPGDEARDWVLMRLMWIWRDVLRKEPSIYLRRNRGPIELEVPEPEGCMKFVVDALQAIEPVLPHRFSSLERKLIDLRPRVPSSPLLLLPSSRDK